MRILLVSFFFPPYGSVGAVRTGKIAEYLTRFGHDVRVVSAREQNVPTATLPLPLDSARVTYAGWWGPRRLVDLILGRGATLGDRNAAGVQADDGSPRRGVARIAAAAKTLAYFPDAQIGWMPFALRAADVVTRNWRPDVIIASASPATSLLVAARLARRLGVPWIADLRDLWVANHAYDHPSWRRRVEERLERSVLRSAAGLVTVSAPLADSLREFGRPVAVVTNGFDPADAPPVTPSNSRAARATLEIVYTGTVYEGRQDPTPLFEAMARIGDPRLRVRFIGSAPSMVRALAARAGVEEQVECAPSVPHADAIREQRDADALLLLLWNDPAQPGVFTTKIFEYLAARRPILGVGYPAGVAADLLRERDAGVVTDSADCLVPVLREWLVALDRGERIADLPPDVAAGLTREDQIRHLERFVREVTPHAAAIARR